MSLKLCPIKLEQVEATRHAWWPLLKGIAERQHCHIEQRLADIYSGTVSMVLAWDDEKDKAQGLMGYSLMKEGTQLRMKLVWMAGEQREEFLHFYDTIEDWARDAGCVGMAADHRQGWWPFLKAKGYKITHMTSEKDFEDGAKQHDDLGNRPIKSVSTSE